MAKMEAILTLRGEIGKIWKSLSYAASFSEAPNAPKPLTQWSPLTQYAVVTTEAVDTSHALLAFI